MHRRYVDRWMKAWYHIWDRDENKKQGALFDGYEMFGVDKEGKALDQCEACSCSE
jgi:hypothetical protein